MNKQLFILTFLLNFSLYSSAQITFQKTFRGAIGDKACCVRQTTDGGYIITGQTYSGAGAGDVYLIKTNANGDSLWTKTFGGASWDYGYSVEQTSDGGYIITGLVNSFGGIYSDIYLIKTDSIGNSLWTKTFGGIYYDMGWSVKQTSDGGYIIAGDYSSSTYITHACLIKTDANGDSLWTKTFGGAISDGGISVQQTADGGYVLAGWTNNFGAGDMDVYLIKTDLNGDTLWTKTFGGTNGDGTQSVQQTNDGGYIIAGSTASFGAGNNDVYLIKTDANGNSLWTKTFGGTNSDWSYSIQQTTDSGYVIVGGTSGFGAGDDDVYLIKTDTNGDTLWTKTFGGTGEDNGNSVQQTSDGGYIITGYTMSFGLGGKNIYLIKTDSMGNSGCNEGSTTTIVTSPATQVTSPATIVSSTATTVISPATLVGGGCITNTLCNCSAYFTLHADTIPHNWIAVNQASSMAPLTYLWDWGDGTTSGGATPSHTYNTPGYYNICLTINDTAGCNSTYCDSSTYLYRGSSNSTVITVNVVLPTSISIIEQNKNTVTITPNPSAGDFIISFEEEIMNGNVEILNIFGKNVFTENIFNESKKEINLKNISSGIYFVKVFDGEKYYCRKIIVEHD